MNKALYWFKSDPPHGRYDLKLANIMFSMYVVCLFLKEVITIYLLGKKYGNVGLRHYFIGLTIIYKEFIIHSTINRYIDFLKICDQKYNNDYYTYDKSGFRETVPNYTWFYE